MFIFFSPLPHINVLLCAAKNVANYNRNILDRDFNIIQYNKIHTWCNIIATYFIRIIVYISTIVKPWLIKEENNCIDKFIDYT